MRVVFISDNTVVIRKRAHKEKIQLFIHLNEKRERERQIKTSNQSERPIEQTKTMKIHSKNEIGCDIVFTLYIEI